MSVFNGSATASITRYQSFPRDWKLELDQAISLDEMKTLLRFVQPLLRDRNALQVLFIYPEKREPWRELIRRNLNELGFLHYFTKRFSRLALEKFDKPRKKINGININRWLNHHSVSDHVSLKSIYQVEYESDYLVRAQHRWDMDNPDYDEFKRRFDSGEANLETLFVAYDDVRPVGLTYAWTDDECGIFFTGTHPDYLGCGIATALKIELAYFSKGLGYDYLTTTNRLSNTAILRTNEKLGFEVLRDEIYYKCPV